MKTFYVSFGGLLRGYHQQFKALNEEIITAFMNKKSGLAGCWCAVYETKPKDTKPLQRAPEILFYQDASHV